MNTLTNWQRAKRRQRDLGAGVKPLTGWYIFEAPYFDRKCLYKNWHSDASDSFNCHSISTHPLSLWFPMRTTPFGFPFLDDDS